MAQQTDQYTILICTKCRGTDVASRMRADLAECVPSGFTFRAVDCMAGCDNPATVGFQATGKATYVFGDIEGDKDIAALATFAHQYQQSETGWTSATERPVALSTKTLARIPALKGTGPL